MTKSTQSRNFLTQLKLLNLIQRGVILVDESGTIKGANKLAASELGYTRKKILDRSIYEINPRYSFLGWKKKWSRLQNDEEIVIESELFTSSGVLFPVVTTLRIVFIDNEPLCCYTFENLLETNRYKDLLELTAEIAQVGGWEYDLVKKNVLITAEVNKLIGGEAEEMSFGDQDFLKWLCQKIGKDNSSELLCQARQAVSEGRDFDYDLRMPDSNRNLKVSGTTLFSEGITSKIYGTLQDISKISARSEEMYMSQFTMDNAIEMIFWVKEDRSIQYVNKAVCEQLGYTQEELLQMDVFDFVPPLNEEQWAQRWKTLRKEKHVRTESIQRTKDGQLLPVISESKYLKYKGEEFICAFVRNQSLQIGRSQLLDLIYHTLNQSNDMIFWVRPDKSFIYFNDTASHLLGYTHAELEELNINTIFDGYDFFDNWEVFRQEKTYELEHEIRDKQGRSIPIEANITFVQFADGECACLTYREITERKKREKELEKAIEEIETLQDKLKEEKTYLKEEVTEKYNFNNIITGSEKYQTVLRQVAQVATTEATVLILGETGTGKELLARSIHQLSDREDAVLIKVNCAALPENLIESELFGHEKGAFTGAIQRKMGRFELANHGTIFLDEIGEMPLDLQAKLLRVLQEGEFERLGGTSTLKTDVRVIAATNRNLEKLVEEGKFREDLYYRLNVFPIRNLPLRERREDIPLLVQHFVKKFCEKEGRPMVKIPKRSIESLMKYNFPGNVRELENIVERALILSDGDKLNIDAVLNRLKNNRRGRRSKHFLSFEEMQKQHIIDALNRCNWKITGKNSAAELLDMNGKTLASKIRKFGINRPEHG